MNNVFVVVPWGEPAKAVTGGAGPSAGGQAVADPRPNLGSGWENPNHFGVVGWDDQAKAVTAQARHDNGNFNVADPRLPEPNERLAALIISTDGTWHRPFTTLELAALQGLVQPGEELELDGRSHGAWRERIGNAIPSGAAEAIAGVIGHTFLLAQAGETFALGATPIWAKGLAALVAVDAAAP